jgi:crotonobetainyl-CoA:carnitine CoA-transferase CaiB-like acyl-CoA transferase
VQNKEMFTGLQVLELASVLAGPSVGQFFAELGADVIKVENLNTGGDVTRSWKIAGEGEGDRSAYFCSCNWGKRSIAVDLGTVQGKEIVHRLAAKSDLVIVSYKPGDAEKLEVSYEQLRGLNPAIIYGQLTGYGSDNDRVGYDAVIQAEAGFMDMNGETEGMPLKMPVALIDVLAGHQLKEALLLALLRRERTGGGCFVEVSLLQTAVSSLANQATNWLIAKKLPVRNGSAHPNIAPYGDTFLTKDGKRIMLAIGNDKQFQQLCDLLDRASVGRMAIFSTNERRVSHRQQLNELLSSAILECESVDLLSSMHRVKIPAGMIQTVQEVFEMPEARATIIKSSDREAVRNFIGLSTGWSKGYLLPPPGFGEHTEEILKSL